MTWQILAVDLDGTVLRGDGVLSPAVVHSLHLAQQYGVHVVLATGRGEAPSLRYAIRLGLTDPVICYQGGLICAPRTQDVLYERLMARDSAIRVARWGREHGRHLLLFADGHVWVEELRYSSATYDQWIGLPLRLVPSLEVTLASGEARRIFKFIDFLAEPERSSLHPMQMWMQAFDDQLQIVRSHHRFVEIIPPCVSKGQALAWLAAKWEIPRQQVIAVGDAENDLSMIEWAGLGVAMGQADEHVRASADWVAPAIDEDGVAAVVDRYILNGVSHG